MANTTVTTSKNNEIDNEKINAEVARQIKTATRTSFFQRLAARFGFIAAANKEDATKRSFGNQKTTSIISNIKLITPPTEDQFLERSTKEEVDLISKILKDTGKNMSDTIQSLFEEWANDTQITYANIAEREERLNAFTLMCDNEGTVKNSVTLVASETASLSEPCAFTVISENKKWQDETNYLLKDVWKYDQNKIYSLAWNIFLYGEAFLGKEVTTAGIVKLNLLSPSEIIERLEFKPSKVAEFKIQMRAGTGTGSSTGFTTNLTAPTNGSFSQSNLNFNYRNNQVTYKSTSDLLKDYIENLADISASEYFTTHLLGYRIFGDQLVAPWQVSHFRFNADVSEFWPYGQPPLLACLAAYKQLQRVMGLDDLDKMLRMPIHLYKVKTNGATTGRALDIVNTVKERFENVGLMAASAGMEGPSLATSIWTSDDLVDVSTVEPSNSNESGATDKMKFFNTRCATSTGIPMSYLDPSSEGFQMSGVALATLFKPFRTLIENIRAIIMSGVEDDIRLHDSIRGVETPDFVLSMNVISPVATEDTSAKLQLASSVLEAIAGLLNVEEGELPKTIKKDILIKYAEFPTAELDSYLQTFEDEGAEKSEVSDEEAEAGFGDAVGPGDFGDMGGGGGDEDFGEAGNEDFGEGGGAEDMPDFEESFKKNKKRLIQERYNAIKNSTNIKYVLTEKLGKLNLSNNVNVFCRTVNDRHVGEAIDYFEQFNVKYPTKHGKGRLNS